MTNKKKCILLLATDLLLLPAAWVCRMLARWLLTGESVCSWVLLGGKCVTCGGTHFVEAFCSGRFAAAAEHNAFLFFLTVLLLIALVLLHLDWLCHITFARKALKKLFSIPTLIIVLGLMLVFFFIRNIPLFTRLLQLL